MTTIKLNDLSLDHNSYISLHAQLHNILRQFILSGRWKHGDRLPSELQLAAHLQVSRTTIRIALQKADVEGLITRIAGRGTFVSYDASTDQNTRFVGFVTRSFHNDIHRILLSSIETELRSANYNVIFSKALTNQEEVDVLQQLLQNDINGLILWSNANVTADQKRIIHEYQARQIPVIFLDRFIEGTEADFVGSDNIGGTFALVKHLHALGHTRIAYLTVNIPNLFPVDERYRGYRQAMQHFDLTPYDAWKINSPHQTEFFETDIFELLDNNPAPMFDQIEHLMQSASPEPTAIVCVNDALAILTMRAMRQQNRNVPDDISIVGFDDISFAAYLGTPLTTVSQNAHEIGRMAAHLMRERLDGDTSPARHITVPTPLQIRMSSSTPVLLDQQLPDD
jgi:DNA-binding LacI/PurR family transcriptional regulator